MRHLRARALGALVGVVTALSAPGAFAQSDEAGAEALLNDAMKLMASHDYARACPVFEESARLYASLNTEYFRANCYEQAGRMATAWIGYLEVAEKAHAAGELAKERKARERASQIEGKVAHLTIKVAYAGPDLEVERDGMEVGRAQWGLPMPVDLGVHVVVASAPGYLPATVRTNVERNGEETSVTIPALQAESPRAPAPAVQPPKSSGSSPTSSSRTASSPKASDVNTPVPPTSGRGQRIAGWIVGGAGVAAAGVAGALALSAKSSYDSAPGCTATGCTEESGANDRASAHRQGNVATVVFILGGAAIVGGGVLWLTAPSSTSARTGGPAGTLRLGVGPGSVALGATF